MPPEDEVEPSPRRSWQPAIGVVVGGAVLIGLLALVDLSLGLVAVAAALGWVGGGAAASAPGSASDRARLLAGVVVGDAAIVLGLLLAWVWSLTEGGVLGPVAYLGERYGPLAIVLVVVAGGVAGLVARSRGT